MELLIEKLTEIVSRELSNSSEKEKQKDFGNLLRDMQNAGIVKKPVYDLPMVDTIGKSFYSTINKKAKSYR